MSPGKIEEIVGDRPIDLIAMGIDHEVINDQRVIEIPSILFVAKCLQTRQEYAKRGEVYTFSPD